MYKAETFKRLVEGADSLNCAGEFSFRTLFFKSSYSYRCCACAFQHEFFQYLSDEGKVADHSMYNKTVRNVRNGECYHVKDTTGEYIQETSVQKHHVYIAVHKSDFDSNMFFGSKTSVLKSRTGLLRLTEYEIAVQKINQSLVNEVAYYKAGFASCTKHDSGPNIKDQDYSQYDPMTLIMSCDESKNETRMTKVSLLEYCIKLRNNELFENVLRIFNPLMVDRSKILSALNVAYELVFRNNLEEMLHILTERDYKIVAESRDHLGVHEGPSLMELAVVYNRPDILDQSLLQTRHYELSTQYQQKLIEICFVLKRKGCEDVLSKHEIHTSKQSWELDIATQIHCLLYLYDHYHYSRDEIQSRLQNIQDIQKNIKISWQFHKWYVLHLQLYIGQKVYNSKNDLDVLKLLLQLGANVEAPEADVGSKSMYDRALIHIFDNANYFTGYLRPSLEMLLFANPSTALGKRNDCLLGLSVDFKDYIEGRKNSVHPVMLPGVYITDTEQHAIYENSDFTNPALRFVVPQLIESGFKFPNATLEAALESGIHPDEKLYLKSCLEIPRKLTKCCRDVLRRHFRGHQIHKFVKGDNIPKTIKDFILLRPILPSVKSLELP